MSTYLVSLQIDKLTTEQKAYLKAHKMKRPEKKAYRNMMKAKKWKWLLAALLFNFGVLGVVKYTNFMIGNINGIIGIFHGQPLSFMNIALPMGISFYTFMSMGYLIDVYRGKTEVEHNLLKLALFVSFFPQVIQGPISRFKDLSQTLYNEHEFDLHQISFGVQRILWGYFKKLVIADRILVGVKALIAEPETYSGFFVFVGMIFYAIELYADVTGGIDITIGIAETLGVKVVENFDRPYFSK
ncbi:MAG: MBOAT family O-acyltransferase, partial [bacterium]